MRSSAVEFVVVPFVEFRGSFDRDSLIEIGCREDKLDISEARMRQGRKKSQKIRTNHQSWFEAKHSNLVRSLGKPD